MSGNITFSDLIYFYRIKKLKNKVSWINSLFYGAFGLILSGFFEFRIYFIEFLALSGIFMVSFSLNDFYDYKIEKDRNHAGIMVKKTGAVKTLVLCLLPAVLAFPAVFLNSFSKILILVFAILSVFYSAPPLRIKRFSKSTPSVLCAGILFLQAYGSLKPISLNAVIMAFLIMLFHLTVEQIHRISEGAKSFALLKALPFVYLLFSVLFSSLNALFIVSVFFSLFRIRALKNIEKQDFKKLRMDLKSGIYSLQEFAVYIAAGILGYF